MASLQRAACPLCVRNGHVQRNTPCPQRANSEHSSAPRRLKLCETAWSRFAQCDFARWIWSSCAALQATHMRMGSIGLLYATQTRAPHCSHLQLNDGVDGIGTSSIRGQASTSGNSKTDIYKRYTKICLDLAQNPGNAKLPRYPRTTIASHAPIPGSKADL